jgi:hypothetical protein
VTIESVDEILTSVQFEVMNILVPLEIGDGNGRIHRVLNGFGLYNAFAGCTFATHGWVHAKLGTTCAMVHKTYFG